MRILVFGATGNVGGHFTRLARDNGHQVTAVARREGPGLTVGEVLDAEFVNKITQGHDVVMSGVGMRYKHPFAKRESPDDLTLRATRNIVQAMVVHGLKRVSIVSAAGVRDRKLLNLPMRILVGISNLKYAYRGLDEAEQVLEASGLDWQAVRPVTLSHAKGDVARIGDSYPATATISREAVAAFMLKELEAPRFTARTPILTR